MERLRIIEALHRSKNCKCKQCQEWTKELEEALEEPIACSCGFVCMKCLGLSEQDFM